MQTPSILSTATIDELFAEMEVIDENIIEITFGGYSVMMENSGDGLQIRVYPITRGEMWDYPAEIFDVSRAEIEAMEKDMEE